MCLAVSTEDVKEEETKACVAIVVLFLLNTIDFKTSLNLILFIQIHNNNNNNNKKKKKKK